MRGQTIIQDDRFLSELGRFLRQHRIKAGFSQRQISQMFGYNSAQFISLWERGKAPPPMEVLRVLIDIYKMDAEKVFRFYAGHFRRILKKQLISSR